MIAPDVCGAFESAGGLQLITFFARTQLARSLSQHHKSFEERKMKSLILAAVAAVGLAGCVAVPGPYAYSDAGYYYPAPAVSIGVGVSSGPGYYGHHYRRW